MLSFLKQAIQDLERAGCETPQLDAEVLLAHALGYERYELYTNTPTTRYQVPGGTLELFKSYIERRKRREPVAYITGFKGFWTLNIKVTPAVLIPRPETEEIIEKAVHLLTSAHPHIHTSTQILDLCTGSGCIATALATEFPQAQITAADISKEALDIARENLAFAKNRVTFVQSDLFENIEGAFDFIVSNPPYIPSAVLKTLEPEITKYEPQIALDGGADGLDFIRQIRKDASRFLKKEGWLVLENGPEVQIWKNSQLKEEFHSMAASM